MGVDNIITKVDNGINLNIEDINKFFSSKNSVISCLNSNNQFLIGNKGNEVIVFNFNKNENSFTIEKFNADLLTQLSGGKSNFHGGVKLISEVNFESNFGYNRNEIPKYINDLSIDYPPTTEAYRFYFMYQFKQLQDEVNKIVQNGNFGSIYENNHKHYLKSIEDLFHDSLNKSGLLNIKSFFMEIQMMKIYSEKVKVDEKFNKLFSDDFFYLQYFSFFKEKGVRKEEDYKKFIDFVMEDKEYNILKYYNFQDIMRHIKAFEKKFNFVM